MTTQWVAVPAGEFTMGTTDEEIARLVARYEWARIWRDGGWFVREQPRRVRLPAYRIGKYPVTNAEYRRFVDAGGYTRRADRHWSAAGLTWRRAAARRAPEQWNERPWNGARRPVVGVTWYEAEAYTAWLTAHLRSTGAIGGDDVVRLPSESEWEHAARGDDGRTWPWGSDWDPARANTREQELGRTTPVGAYPAGASPCGALDMAGNVWEWCAETYDDLGRRRLRGGAWDFFADHARPASRGGRPPEDAFANVGFRCVLASAPVTPSTV